MTRIARSWLAALVFAGLATGCLIPRFQRPEVTFQGVRLGGLGIRGGTVYVQFRIANPNSYRLETVGFTYDVQLRVPVAGDSLSWLGLAAGRYDQGIQVPGRDSARVEIPVDFTYAGLSGALLALSATGTFDYRLNGTVDVRAPIRRSVPYRHTGAVSLQGIR